MVLRYPHGGQGSLFLLLADQGQVHHAQIRILGPHISGGQYGNVDIIPVGVQHGKRPHGIGIIIGMGPDQQDRLPGPLFNRLSGLCHGNEWNCHENKDNGDVSHELGFNMS